MERQELTRAIKRITPNTSSLAFGAALVMVQFWAYINFKGEGFSQPVALIYIFMPVAFASFLYLDQQAKMYQLRLEPLRLLSMLVNGFFGFIITWAFMLIVIGYGMGVQFGNVTTGMVPGLLVTQVLFVACSEELMFRYLLPSYYRTKFVSLIPPLLITQLMFALFHWGVYGGDVSSLIIAFIAGTVWFVAVNVQLPGMEGKLGLGFTIGSHAAYNLCLLGVLAGNITTLTGGG